MNKLLLQPFTLITVSLILISSRLTHADEIQIPLHEGNNFTSINMILPDSFRVDAGEGIIGFNVPMMWERLRIDEDNHLVLLIKNGSGRWFAPAFGFNNIPFWDLTEAYDVYVSEDVDVLWEGELVNPQMDINLSSGGNRIAYLPSYLLSAGADDFHIFSLIIDVLEKAVNSAGEYMIPEYGFSNMHPGRPGEGYYIKVSEDVVLNYPEEGNGELFYPWVGDHWEIPQPTEEWMGMMITEIGEVVPDSGDQIAAIDLDGVVVGVGAIQIGACAMTVWGADEGEEFGLEDGEAFELLYWDDSEQLVFEVEVERFIEGNGLRFQDDFLVIEIATGMSVSDGNIIPHDFHLSPIHPNPFNAVATIEYSIPSEAHVSLTVLDVTGRTVATLINEALTAGEHKAVWNGMSNPSGVYLFRLDVDGNVFVKRGVLLR